MRVCIGRMDGEWTAQQLRDEIVKDHAHLADKLTAVCVMLIDMSNRGEVIRKGAGRKATYRRGKLKNDKETAWREFRKTIPTPAAAE